MATWNTTTQPTDRERIRLALLYPAAKLYIDAIQSAMDRITNESPDSIATVQDILGQLDEVQETLTATLTDTSYAMIKADVVEWEPGGKRAEGMQSQLDTLTVWLATTMNLEVYTGPGTSSGSSSDGILLRS